MIYDYQEILCSILRLLNLSTSSFWSHDELLGSCSLSDIQISFVSSGSQVVYHFGNCPKNIRNIISDAIILVNYSDKLVYLRSMPRPVLDSLHNDDILIRYPVRDGTTFKLHYFLGTWLMTSKGNIDISNKSLFGHTFMDLFLKQTGSLKKYDESIVYLFNLVDPNNCPYKDTKESLVLLEEEMISGNDLTLTLHKAESQDSRFGTVYRTNNGVFIEASKEYLRMSSVIYALNNKEINGIIISTGLDPGLVRRSYIITRAVLTEQDFSFTENYPAWISDYEVIKSFIGSIIRLVYSQCMTKVKNPNRQGLIKSISDIIGPLKTANGQNIVIDTVYDKRFVSAICEEYLNKLSLSKMANSR